jgi:hypothetical protein
LILIHATVWNQIAKPCILARKPRGPQKELIQRLTRGPVVLRIRRHQFTRFGGKLDCRDDRASFIDATTPEDFWFRRNCNCTDFLTAVNTNPTGVNRTCINTEHKYSLLGSVALNHTQNWLPKRKCTNAIHVACLSPN